MSQGAPTRRSTLELDDIQYGALHERPSPYVATYLLARIDDRAGRPGAAATTASAGRRRSTRARCGPGHGGSRWRSPIRASRRSVCPRPPWRASRPSSAKAWPLAPPSWVTCGDSSPDRWEPPLGTPGRPCGDRHPVARRRALAGVARRGPAAPTSEHGRRRGDLASGLLPAADRSHVVRVQGRDRPAGHRRQRHAGHQPDGAAHQGRRVHPRLPRRNRRPAAACRPGDTRSERDLHRLSKTAHPGGRLPSVPAGQRLEPAGGDAAGRQDGGPLAEWRPAGALPRPRRP